ncbi:MAG: hypothetical protein V1790_10550 [Planctomycetota bacterium]
MTFIVVTLLGACLICALILLRRAWSKRESDAREECGRCGQRNPRLAKFCARCGTKLE